MTLPQAIRSYLGLCKLPIAFYAALSAGAGLLLSGRPHAASLTASVAGVFLMACGACALNHFQERKTDARMPRTAGRPLPSGRVRPGGARRFALVLIGSGAVVLLATGAWAAPLLGLAAVFWYNGFYTWLKARHAFAAIPGALVGALPPAIGWAAAGAPADLRLAALCFFFFMWQVPHFLLHQQAYGKEYEAIRLPSLTALFSETQLARLTFQWLLAAAVSLQLVVLYGLIQTPLVHAALLAASLGLAARGGALLGRHAPSYAGLFRSTNVFMLLALLLIFLDRLPAALGWAG